MSKLKVDKIAVWGLILIGLTLKGIYLLRSNGGNLQALPFSDEGAYYLAAANMIAEQGWDFFKTERSLWNGPLNPLWIYSLGRNIALIKACNLLLLQLAAVLIWDVARKYFTPGAALITLAALTFHPPFYVFGATLLTEPLFIFLLSLGVWLICRPNSKPIWGGVVWGLATLVRPTLQFFPLLLIALGVVASGDLRKKLHSISFSMLLLILPYVAKNWIYLNQPIIANGFGAVLYLGNDLRRNGDEPIYSGFDFDTPRYTAPVTHLDSFGDKNLKQAAIRNITQHPFDILLLSLVKAPRFLMGNPMHYFYPSGNSVQAFRDVSGFYFFIRIVELLLAVSVVIWGFSSFVVLRSWTLTCVTSASLVLYFLALHTIAFPIPRLGLPIFPVLSLWAGGLLATSRFLSSKKVVLWILALMIVIGISFKYYIYLPNVVSQRYVSYFSTTHDLPINPAAPLSFEVAPFSAHRNRVLFLKMSVLGDQSTGKAQLFWADDKSDFTEEASLQFPIREDAKSHIYRITPGLSQAWKGQVSKLKFKLLTDHSLESQSAVEFLKVAE